MIAGSCKLVVLEAPFAAPWSSETDCCSLAAEMAPNSTCCRPSLLKVTLFPSLASDLSSLRVYDRPTSLLLRSVELNLLHCHETALRKKTMPIITNGRSRPFIQHSEWRVEGYPLHPYSHVCDIYIGRLKLLRNMEDRWEGTQVF